MCGLIGWINKGGTSSERAREYVVSQFEDQYLRGTKGFGLTEINEDGSVVVLRATTEAKMLLDLYMSKAKNILLHHRSPTSSANTMDQTHPLEVEHEELKYRWLVNHNGTISNASKLKEEHEKLGYYYLTAYQEEYTSGNGYYEKFNDSESFAIELARYLEGVSKEMRCTGGLAFMAVAIDEKGLCQRIYLGTNGYGGLKLHDYKKAFGFASEEPLGDSIKKDECIRFDAVYDEKTKKLVSFSKQEEPLTLKFESIVSPYHKPADAPRMGYHHNHLPKEGAAGGTASAASTGNAENVKFTSFGHIVEYVTKSRVGEVLQDTEALKNDGVANFNLVEFNKAIVLGKPEEAEDIYQTYIEGLAETLDVDGALDDCLQPVEVPLPGNPTTGDIVDMGLDVQRKRINRLVKQFLPLFKLCSYCECVMTLAYQFKMELSSPPEDKGTEVSAQIDNANPDVPLADQGIEGPKEFDDEINKLWPSKGKDDERMTTNLIPVNAEYKEVSKPDLDEEASIMLQAFSESVPGSHPEDVYQDAESVADVVRTATEIGIMEQLGQIQMAAIEMGAPLRIPFHINKIKDILETAQQRYQTLAHIVKSTHQKEEADDGIFGSRYD